MSRIGRMPIPVPAGVKVNIEGQKVTVTGPKGELSRSLLPDMKITLENDTLTVNRPTDCQEHRSQHGLTRTLLDNMVTGVSKGFEKTLDIVGVGYRAEMAGSKLVLRMGFSHPVEIEPMPGIAFAVDGNNRITVSGINKENVGETAANIRKVRPPDAYKGKGIRYTGEKPRLKPGKAGKVAGR